MEEGDHALGPIHIAGHEVTVGAEPITIVVGERPEHEPPAESEPDEEDLARIAEQADSPSDASPPAAPKGTGMQGDPAESKTAKK